MNLGSSSSGAFSPPSRHSLSAGLEPAATVAANEDNSTKYSRLSNEVDADEDDFFDFWRINVQQKEYYKEQFRSLQSDLLGTVRGNVAKVFFEKSGLPVSELSRIWKLSDIDKDGALSLPEFCIAMHLVVLRRNNVEVPHSMPDTLLEIYGSLAQDGHQFPSPFGSLSGPFQARFSLDDMSDHGQRSASEGHTPSTSHSATKQWTLFNESPIFSSTESTSRTSPDQQPVNFDYNAESIAANPHIKHPVPLRFSPSASPRSAFSRLSNEASSLSPGGAAGADSQPDSLNQHLISGTSFLSSVPGEWHVVSGDSGGVHHCTTLTPPAGTTSWSNGTSTERKPYLIPRDGQIETMLAVQGLEEILLARYMPPPPPEVIKPNSFSSPDELQSSLRELQDYANTVTKQNESLLGELLTLVKLVRKRQKELQKPPTPPQKT